VDHGPGAHDDLANSALGAALLALRPVARTRSFYSNTGDLLGDFTERTPPPAPARFVYRAFREDGSLIREKELHSHETQ
jgi:hypothetical protein